MVFELLGAAWLCRFLFLISSLSFYKVYCFSYYFFSSNAWKMESWSAITKIPYRLGGLNNRIFLLIVLSGGWEVQGQGTGRFSVLLGQKGPGSSLGFLKSVIILFMSTPPSRTNQLPKERPAPPNIHWGLDFNMWILRGYKHSVYSKWVNIFCISPPDRA